MLESQGGAEDVDAVFLRPLPIVVGVRLVRQGATVRDGVHLEGKRRVSGGRLQEPAPTIAGRGLDEDHVLRRLGGETGLLPDHLREGLHDLSDDFRRAQDPQVVRHRKEHSSTV